MCHRKPKRFSIKATSHSKPFSDGHTHDAASLCFRFIEQADDQLLDSTLVRVEFHELRTHN